jgi:hypothetical protein
MNEPTDTLTPLQQAALERILFFQKELKKRGLKVRMAFEQEFVIVALNERGEVHEDLGVQKSIVDASRGILFPDGGVTTVNNRGKQTNYQHIVDILKPRFPSIQEIEKEFAGPPILRAIIDDQLPIYEVKFDAGQKCELSPSQLAQDVLNFRKHAMEMLDESRDGVIFSEFLGAYSHRNLKIIYDPLPAKKYPSLDKLEGQMVISRHRQPLGLHIDASVYDASGNCLCDNYGFYRAISERLLNLQYKAGLGFIQNAEALERLGVNKASPKKIGLGAGNTDSKHDGYSLLERHKPYFEHRWGPGGRVNIPPKGTYYPDRYLENRMVAADADPFVVTALELAAIYDAVTTAPELKDKDKIDLEYVNHAWNTHMGDIKHDLDHPIEKEMRPWVERFKRHDELRKLLGDALYDGVLQAYGKDVPTVCQ